MNTNPVSSSHLSHPNSLRAFRSLRLLVGGYLTLSAATIVAIVALRNHHSIVTSAVWVRGSIVVVSALVMFALTMRAATGSRGAYKRLRILSAVFVVVIAVIVSLPGVFPVWMRIEQGVCGLILLGVAAIANGKHLRSVFAAK